MFRNLLFVFFILLSFSFAVKAQRTRYSTLSPEETKVLKKEASMLFTLSDFKNALGYYQELYRFDPQNADYNFKLGFCYLKTSINKKEALRHLEIACQSKEMKKEWIYYLGMAYMYNEKWDEAEKKFNEYITETRSKVIKDYPSPERMIEMCHNGKELCAKPVNCSFKNLGKTINTIYEEYNPYISADEKSLVFTSRRKGNVGGFIEELGMFTSDIYRTTWKDSIWTKPKNIGANVNTEWDEETVGLTPLGDMIMIYLENLEVFGDVGASSLKGKMWQRTELLPQHINSNSYEGGACLTLDGSTVIFSSNRKDGMGGTDLWTAHKQKDGQWTEPVNLGNTINTSHDEDMPYLSLDGQKLYFCSKGWNTMGGFDIFYSHWDSLQKNWKMPENIGFPLNDADDNKYFSITGDERFAYISAIREDGVGDRDIYKVEFLDLQNKPCKHIVSGTVVGTIGKIELTKVTIENKLTMQKLEFRPLTTNNQFVFAVDPGEYKLQAEGYTFLTYSEDLIIKNDFPPKEINLDIHVRSSR